MLKNIYRCYFKLMLCAILYTLVIFSPKVYAESYHSTGAVLLDDEQLDALQLPPVYRNYLPEAIDLSNRIPAPGNQGKQGSCVGWAVGYAARSYYELASYNHSLQFKNNLVSPSYIYDAIRSDKANCNSGSSIYDALKLLVDYGSLSLKDYHYDDKKCRASYPTENATQLGFKIKGWSRVDTGNLDQIKAELAHGHPIIVSILTNKSFHQLKNTQPVWRAKAPKIKKRKTGHAITVIGYDDRKKRFKFINSWGKKWGKSGFGFMTYQTFENRVRAAYVLRPEKAPKKPVAIEKKYPKKKKINTKKIKLPQLDCSLISVKQHKQDSRPTIQGFVSTPKDRLKLETLFNKTHTIDVSVKPWPMCEALLITHSSNKAAELTLDSSTTRIGDTLIFTVTTPNFSSYLHLAYFQADGQVINLFQSAYPNLETYLPHTKMTLGDGQNSLPTFKIMPPTGEEMLLAITTKSPLFTQPRPQNETEREFLSALRSATIDLEKNTGVSRYYAANTLTIHIEDSLNEK